MAIYKIYKLYIVYLRMEGDLKALRYTLRNVRRKGDAVTVMEGDLAVVHFFAFGKCLVPLLCQIQLLHTQTSLPI